MSFWVPPPAGPFNSFQLRSQTLEELSLLADPITRAVAKNILEASKPAKRPKQTLQIRCDLCGVSVPSKQIMRNHLEGKAHKRKIKNQQLLEQLKQDSNCQQQQQPEKTNKGDQEEIPVVIHLQQNNQDQQPKLQPHSEAILTSQEIKCDICNLSVNSVQQLNIHKSGAKHKKLALKKRSNVDQEMNNTEKEVLIEKRQKIVPANHVENLPNSIIRLEDLPNNKKVAGTYKCKSCDCLLNSEFQLQQHLKSQRHEMAELGIPNVSTKLTKEERKHFHPYLQTNGVAKFKQKLSQTSNSEKWGKNSSSVEETFSFPSTPLTANFVLGEVLK